MTDVNKNRRLKPRRRASPGAGLRSGITRRWARGSLLVIVLLLAVIEGMFLYSTIQGYYDGVQQSMYRRFSSINGQLKVYSSGTVQRTAASRSFALRRMVEQFSDKDKYEFMLLDGSGNVISLTYRAVETAVHVYRTGETDPIYTQTYTAPTTNGTDPYAYTDNFEGSPFSPYYANGQTQANSTREHKNQIDTTSITVTKVWAGDNNDVYVTRPSTTVCPCAARRRKES